MTPENPDRSPDRASAYWKSTSRMTMWLLLLWFGVTSTAIFFARQLSGYTLFGWPISFFMAAQGSILIYVTIVAVYAWRMRRLDRIHNEGGRHEQQ